MIDRLWKALSRDRLRREAEARRKATAKDHAEQIVREAEAVRARACAPLKLAMKREDRRGEGERFPAAHRATIAALEAEVSLRGQR